MIAASVKADICSADVAAVAVILFIDTPSTHCSLTNQLFHATFPPFFLFPLPLFRESQTPPLSLNKIKSLTFHLWTAHADHVLQGLGRTPWDQLHEVRDLLGFGQ
jgi:hypothetical protein